MRIPTPAQEVLIRAALIRAALIRSTLVFAALAVPAPILATAILPIAARAQPAAQPAAPDAGAGRAGAGRADAQGADPEAGEVELVPRSSPLPDLTDPNARAAERLDEPGPNSGIPRALRGSASKAGGPANDLNPGGAAEAPSAPRGDLGRVLAGRELYHGNYCGVGQRGEGLPPIDALDAACQRHDACYDAAGHRSCACDAALMREAAAVSESLDSSLEVRRRALSVAEAATGMGCRAP